MRRTVLSLLLLAAALAASVEIGTAAKEGVGLSPDSVLYISAARNIATGKGVSTPTAAGIDLPLTLVPPAYPLVLALLVRFCPGHFFAAARWLNAGLFGVLAAIIAAWAYRRSNRSVFLAGIVVALLLSSLDLLRVYTMLWSETSFLPLTFAALWLLDTSVDEPSSGRLMAAALLTAAAWLTRYAGIVTVAAGSLAIVCCQKGPVIKRVRRSITFAAAAGLPMAAWLMRNFFLAHQATSRHFAFHPLLGQFSEAVQGVLSLWFFQTYQPDARMAVLGASLLAIFAVLCWVYGKRTFLTASLQLPLIFSFCYLALIIVIAFFYEAQLLAPGEYDRILAPLHVAFLLSAAAAFSQCDWPKSLGRTLGASAAVMMVCLGYKTVGAVKELSEDGQQYAGRAWRSSESIRYIEHVPSTMHVYTNGPQPVYLYANRSCYEIPPKVLASTQLANPAYSTLMDRIHAEIVQGIAVVVYFDREKRPQFPSEAELKNRFHASTMKTRDGMIFSAKPH
jgi:hypothetical protein